MLHTKNNVLCPKYQKNKRNNNAGILQQIKSYRKKLNKETKIGYFVQSYFFCKMISGAIYSGVPHSLLSPFAFIFLSNLLSTPSVANLSGRKGDEAIFFVSYNSYLKVFFIYLFMNIHMYKTAYLKIVK